MRVFIAIDIDEQTKKALGRLQEELRGHAGLKKGDVKWVRPEIMHLTLKFLGEVRDDQIADVCDIVKTVAAAHKCFDLNVQSVGCFGGSAARIVWVGTAEGNRQARFLQEDIEKNLHKAGWPRETREFSSHLTLSRVKKPGAGTKLKQIIENYGACQFGITQVDSVRVYQSELTPTGPIYTVLGSYNLQ
ncbi:MAG: RNA 2',3'-cyclic phosphodiesterase [Planctomycetota bacterium]|jgi:2'-5' RNA ligase